MEILSEDDVVPFPLALNPFRLTPNQQTPNGVLPCPGFAYAGALREHNGGPLNANDHQSKVIAASVFRSENQR